MRKFNRYRKTILKQRITTIKYISIDIETTGLDYRRCQIIQFGAVIDDLLNPKPIEELPKLLLNLDPGKIYGEPYALNLNKDILEGIKKTKPQDKVYTGMLPHMFRSWLDSNGFLNKKVNLAGKNLASFDLKFLEKLDDWNTNWFNCRILDPSVLWLEPQVDKEIPNLDTCLKRAEVEKTVSHNALEDSIDVVRIIRAWYNK